MVQKKTVYSNDEQLLHAPDTCVRMSPVIVATLTRAVTNLSGNTQTSHGEVVFEMKDARVTVNVHVERK